MVNFSFIFSNFFLDVTLLINFFGDKVFYVLALGLNLGLSLAQCIANIALASDLITKGFGGSKYIILACLFLLYLSLITLILEPEKIKPLTIIVTILILITGKSIF